MQDEKMEWIKDKAFKAGIMTLLALGRWKVIDGIVWRVKYITN